MAKRAHQVWVVLSEEENELLTKAAEAVGLSVASYTRSCAITAAAKEINERPQWIDKKRPQ